MANITIPYRPSGSDTKDISQLIADFDAILAQANGNLEANVNVKTATGATLDGNSNAEGSSASIARADHKHLIQGVERLSADPTTGNFVGRVYFNTTTSQLRICSSAAGSGTFRVIVRSVGTDGVYYESGGAVAVSTPSAERQMLFASSGLTPTWAYPRAARKASDTGRASTTTLAADPDLVIPVIAGEVVVIEGLLIVSGGTGADIQVSIGGSFTGTGNFFLQGPGVGETLGGGSAVAVRLDVSDLSAIPRGCMGTNAGDHIGMPFKVVLSVSGAGNAEIRWAQVVSTVTATTVHANSYMVATRIA